MKEKFTKKFIIIILIIILIASYYIYKSLDRYLFLRSLDGEIVYTDRDNSISNVYKISANGSNKKLLYHNEDTINSNSLFPMWSEDGTEVYFKAMKNMEWKRFIINSDGSNVRILDSLGEGEVTETLVSHNSREKDIISEKGSLYYEENGERFKVYSFSNYDEKMSTGAQEASWSPDKKFIVFESCSFIWCNIMITDKEKAKTIKLTKGSSPDWKRSSSQKIQLVEGETADWQTYNNETYGYSFKYPSGCFLGPQPSYCKPKTTESPSECFCNICDGWLQKMFIDDNFSIANFIVRRVSTSWYNPAPDIDLINFIIFLKKEALLYEEIPEKPNYEIDGIPAIKVYTSSSPMAGATEEIYFIKDNILLNISMSWMDNNNTAEFLNNVLSTFKFTQ